MRWRDMVSNSESNFEGPNSRSQTPWLAEGINVIFSAFLVRETNLVSKSAVRCLPSLISLKQAVSSSGLVAISSILIITGSFLGEAGLGGLNSKAPAEMLRAEKGLGLNSAAVG